MSFQIPAFAPALPEIIVLTMACAILVIDLYITEERRSLTYLLTQLTLVVAALATLGGMPAEPSPGPSSATPWATCSRPSST